jgi:predicted 2-oxoglutarate/Fe(II)-dependent dioxygenase YbiX
MKIEVVTEPFNHIIIHDVFDAQQLANVWTELDFLHHRLLRVGENGFTGGSAKDNAGNPLKSNKSLSLNDLYNYQNNISYIIQYLVNLFHSDEVVNISTQDLEHYYRLYTKARTFYFHVQYYENDDGYKSHRDVSIFTNTLFLFKEPKNFIGGDLVFDEYDYAIPCDANKMIIFPSVLNHAVTPIKMLDDTPMTGRYSITVFQNIK